MLPILVKIGPITIRAYGLMYATGVILGLLVSLRLAKRDKLNPTVYLDFAFWMLICSILGAKLFMVLTDLGYYLRRPSDLKYILLSGGTFYGGLICGLLFSAFYIRRKKLIFRQIADVTMPGLALGHFFGRLGCFAAGCCFGRPAPHFPLAVTFHKESARAFSGVPLGIRLYPTQLAEALLNLLNFLFLFWLFPRRKYRGQVLVLYVLNYSLIRFFLEYFRGDSDRGYIFGSSLQPFSSLSLPQLISLGGIILAFILNLVFRKKGAKENLS